MTSKPMELEGTWEEIIIHSKELAGKRVRVTVLRDEPESPSSETPSPSNSTAESLLRYAGTWEGDDLEECLQMVYDSRAPLEF
ncbi:hypothetical protein [Coleofasciculus sp. FACHB-129]|uniref:hypothetical protein n=1 Tax=Cyanophyceae TaxID=3028117 RepID=UPI0016897F0A|nr:hypothetical protein [Coleofasciculus sp. FACHB-129]MBD1893125.1 hypothetical protein [Coleofasciculus sp. FACHB-129]